ncbi:MULTISPECIES: hypothetical protein [unclassified Rhizobium]|uniref:hypothetical protein n=1 Tax=unclassified Rhizobium TaxID=2613769 RepID=UPI00115CA8D3|nr:MULTISPECIES: hypothetical protein [unclassified Rhizobium]TQX90240.1 hypothetical protein EQW76_11090 [Rhizobium sp. rho-13.1]TQY16190.1 hypothetical protein EQW74_10680 [Rhizobium sp. rho-1.1]
MTDKIQIILGTDYGRHNDDDLQAVLNVLLNGINFAQWRPVDWGDDTYRCYLPASCSIVLALGSGNISIIPETDLDLATQTPLEVELYEIPGWTDRIFSQIFEANGWSDDA